MKMLLHPLLLALVAGTAFTVSARSADADLVHPFIGEEQRIAQAGRPAWLEEGLRLSYEAGDSSRTSGPNGRGSGGVGLLQVDIVAVGRAKVGLELRFLMREAMNQSRWGRPIAWGITTAPGKGDKFWIHPAVLAHTAKQLAQGNLGWRVAEGSLEVGGKTFQCFSFGFNKDGVVVNRWYDKKTGIMLQEGTQTKSGNTQAVSHAKFLGVRKRALPWTGGRPPAWIFKTRQFQFATSHVISMPGAAPYRQQGQIALDVTGKGANFITWKYPVSQPGIPNTGVSGPSGTGGVWIPPLRIRNLKAGQELDRDPHTDATLRVQFVGRSRYGRQVVTLVEAMPGLTNYVDYELDTGALLMATSQVASEYASTQLRLVGRN